MTHHRGPAELLEPFGALVSQDLGVGRRAAGGNVAVSQVMSRGQISHHIGSHVHREQLLEELDRVQRDPHRQRPRRGHGLPTPGQRLRHVRRGPVDEALVPAALELVRVHLRAEDRAAEHRRYGQRLRRAHPPEPRRHDQTPVKVAGEMLACDGGERLVGALNDPLRADVLPGPRGEPAPGHEPGTLQLVEARRSCEAAHEVAVGHHHQRRDLAGGQHANRLAGLHHQRLTLPEDLEDAHDSLVGGAVAGRLRMRGVDHEIVGALGQLEVVLEQSEDGLLTPATAAQPLPAGGAHERGGGRLTHASALVGAPERLASPVQGQPAPARRRRPPRHGRSPASRAPSAAGRRTGSSPPG